MLQTLFPGERPIFQDDNAVHTCRCVQTWLHEHDDEEVEHLTWCPQSHDLNIIEPLWGNLENKETKSVLGFLLHAHYLNSRRPCTRNGCEFRWTLFKTFIYIFTPTSNASCHSGYIKVTQPLIKNFHFLQVFLFLCPIPVFYLQPSHIKNIFLNIFFAVAAFSRQFYGTFPNL
jgi:hypothetical protein